MYELETNLASSGQGHGFPGAVAIMATLVIPQSNRVLTKIYSQEFSFFD